MNTEDLNILLFCSFRYALGRRTYIVGDVSSLLRKHKDEMDKRTRMKIIEEIYMSVAAGSAGTTSDTNIWHDLAIDLEEDLH